MKKVTPLALAAVALTLLLGGCSDDSNLAPPTVISPSPTSSSLVEDGKVWTEPDPTPAPADEEKSQLSLTAAQENALLSAVLYLESSGFSKSGLREQLEFEGFSQADARFAVDNVTDVAGTDWTEQAVRSAREYLDVSPFSRDGLIEQLQSEGFTYGQAAAGVRGAGL